MEEDWEIWEEGEEGELNVCLYSPSFSSATSSRQIHNNSNSEFGEFANFG
jgi:hypothetical protein